MSELRSGNDVLEAVYEYYQLLLRQLTTAIKSIESLEEDEEEESVVHFSNFFYGLRNTLEKQINSAQEKQSQLFFDALSTKAKQQLFKVYCDELISFHKKRNNEELAQQLQYLFSPYKSIASDEKRVKSEPRNDEDKDMESIPISAIYKQTNKNAYSHLLTKNDDASAQKKPIGTRVLEATKVLFPWMTWIPQYRHHLHDLKDDIVAGITVGALAIPQSMAYATIAGMPPVYGLYTCLLPIFMYAIFGTSRQLAVGPTAVSALLLASSITSLPGNMQYGSPVYITYALFFAVFGGIIQLLMGIFRLGFLVNFLSNPVLSGFTSAAALIIAASQLNNFLGLHIPKGDTRIQFTIINLFKQIPSIHFPTLAMGVMAIFFLYFIDHAYLSFKSEKSFHILRRKFTIPKKITLKWLPSSFLLVITGILSVLVIKRIGNYDTSANDIYGIAIVGKVPGSLPKPSFPSIPDFGLEKFQKVLLLCFSVVVVSFMESISTAKLYASQRGYEIDTNQELIALGAANLVGGLFKAFPATGSLCRTSVSANAGSKTPLAGIITGSIVLLTLLVLTPLFYHLPMPVLAAVIIHSTTKIPDYDQVTFTFRTKKLDCALLALSFFCTLFIGILEGILIAAGCSLVLVVLRSSRPPFFLLGRIPGSTAYQEVTKISICKQVPGVIITRFDADLYFANVQYFKDCVKRFIRKSEYQVFAVVMDCSGIGYADSTASHAFKDLKLMLKERNIEFLVAQMKKPIKRVVKRGAKYDTDQFFIQLHDAVLHAESIVSTKLRDKEVKQKLKLQTEEASYSTYNTEEDMV